MDVGKYQRVRRKSRRGPTDVRFSDGNPSVSVGRICGSRGFAFACVLNVGEGVCLAGKCKFRERSVEEKEREERESEG